MAEQSPNGLINDLVAGLMANQGLIRGLAMKAKHIPANEFCTTIARALVDQINRAGVEEIVRRTSSAHRAPAPDSGLR